MKKKYSLILVSLFFVLLSCKQEEKIKIDRLPEYDLEEIENIINNPKTAVKTNEEEGDSPKLVIENAVFDFGEIQQGKEITHRFKIKNIGAKELIIFDLRSSCGCTVARKPEQSIKPMGEDYIEVKFDSKDKIGIQSRKISIHTNGYPSEYAVEFRGNVLEK